MGFTTIVFIASLGLLRMPHSLVITHTKPANALVPKDHVSAPTASTAGQLMLPEDIVFYGSLILVALMIAGLYSFILGHGKSSRTRSIPTLLRETYDYLTTKDHVASEFVRPDSRVRGPSKPAVQVQGIPTYLEKLAHSPTEEHTSHVFGASTSAPTQNAESRGRMDAVAKSSAADRSVPVSSVQSAIPKDRAGGATARLSSRKKTYTRRVHTAPCATIPNYTPRLSEPEKPENALLGSLRGFQLRPAMPDQNTLVHVLAIGLSWRHIKKKALPGPEHDLCWLKNFFVDQKRVQFTSLLDNEVSFDTIHLSVTRIYSDAQPNDCLVLYFTGHGDDENAFELYDDDPGSLDEVILNDWIVKLRRETSKTIPVYIIFDFCRENPASSSAQLDSGVTVFWSCPPGQKSPDMMLSKDLPYSCFLLALFLAIDDSSKFHASHTLQYFVFARRLVELLNVIWGIRSFRPGSWRRKRWCRHPNSCNLCWDKRHNSRDGVGWPDPRSFEVLANMHLGELPDFSVIARYASTHLPLSIHKIRELLEDNQWFLYFNPSRINTNKGSSTPGTRKFRSRRVQDMIESTVQARGRTLPLGALPAVPIPISK